jgi:hypothetical protein
MIKCNPIGTGMDKSLLLQKQKKIPMHTKEPPCQRGALNTQSGWSKSSWRKNKSNYSDYVTIPLQNLHDLSTSSSSSAQYIEYEEVI